MKPFISIMCLGGLLVACASQFPQQQDGGSLILVLQGTTNSEFQDFLQQFPIVALPFKMTTYEVAQPFKGQSLLSRKYVFSYLSKHQFVDAIKDSQAPLEAFQIASVAQFKVNTQVIGIIFSYSEISGGKNRHYDLVTFEAVSGKMIATKPVAVATYQTGYECVGGFVIEQKGGICSLTTQLVYKSFFDEVSNEWLVTPQQTTQKQVLVINNNGTIVGRAAKVFDE